MPEFTLTRTERGNYLIPDTGTGFCIFATAQEAFDFLADNYPGANITVEIRA